MNYHKKYYADNKDKILTQMYSKDYCDICDCKVNHCGFTRHCRSKKHMKRIELASEIENMTIDELKKNLDYKKLICQMKPNKKYVMTEARRKAIDNIKQERLEAINII